MEWLNLLGLRAFTDRWRALAIEGAIAADDRTTLFGLEFQEYKRGVIIAVSAAMALAVLSIVVLIVLSAAIVVHFWDTPDRSMAAWIVTGVWAVLWCVAAGVLWTLVGKAGNGFSATRRELARDWHEIKERL